MKPIQTLIAQTQALVETAQYLKYLENKSTTRKECERDLISELFGYLKDCLFQPNKPYRPLTTTECIVLLRTSEDLRYEWLKGLEDDQREHVLSQVPLPEIIDFESDIDDEGYSYDPDSFATN